MPDHENPNESISGKPHLFGSIPKMTLVYSSLSLVAFLTLMILMINLVRFPQFVTTQISLSLGERTPPTRLIGYSDFNENEESQLIQDQLAFLTNFKTRMESFHQVMINDEQTDPTQFIEGALSSLENRINELKTNTKGNDQSHSISSPGSKKVSLSFQIPTNTAELITTHIILDLIQGDQFPYEAGNVQLLRIEQDVRDDMTLVQAICQIDSQFLNQWGNLPMTFQVSIPIEELSALDLVLRKFTGLFRQDSSF